MAKFKKGDPKIAGRKKGTPNKKTAQWENFVEYCMNSGLEKFQQEMDKLQGKAFTDTFINLIEYHKPKLARTELTGDGGNAIEIKITREDS